MSSAVEKAFSVKNLISTRKFVLVTIALESDEEGIASISLDKLAERTNLSVSTVVAAVNFLCDARLIERWSVGSIKERTTTKYKVLVK